ncbi:MAG: YhfC family intramembrane metalloprotease [Candidatus Aenigmatarchaeota archaeon]|nr:MAG: YhfC family intramembrane metalloprotease [Candidatus Aenigmarchaeota archaeon]
MINPIFILSGIGMMLVGIVPVLWWRYRTLVPWRYFATGALVWLIAITVKVAMDLTVTIFFVNWLTGIYTALGIAIISGAYVGLRTGLLESGFGYLAVLRGKLKDMTFRQAFAFGMGFGASEAFVLGMLSFLNIAVLLAFPQVLDLLTPIQRAGLLEQLTLPPILVLAPIIERAFTLAVHIFCMVLVVQSVKTGKASYFIVSFLFKTALDGALPFLTMNFDLTSVLGVYYIESFVAVMGLISAVGLFWLKSRYGERHKKRTRRPLFLAYVAAISVIITVAAFLLAQSSVASKIERRNIAFDGLEGSYDFILNGTGIGTSEFEFAGGTEYKGQNAFIINEHVNLSSGTYSMFIESELYVTVDARPLFYNTTIHKNGESKNIVSEFRNGLVEQTSVLNNRTQTSTIPYNEDAFIIANNMISHWVLLFRAADLQPENTYVARLYSPDIGAEVVRSFEVADVREIEIRGRIYESYVFKENTGSLNYVTPAGDLLKIESGVLEIVISDGEPPEEGGIFM